MTDGLKRGLVISVGGTPAPVIKAIARRKPDFILFAASEGTKPLIENEILPALDYIPQCQTLTLTDYESIGDCYREMRDAMREWLGSVGMAAESVYVDYTGGTKTMSAALVLAGVERFSAFTYVGGERRDKGGLGVVLDGTEAVIPSQNPWNQYAARDLERANDLLSGYHADAAADILDEAANKCDPEHKNKIRGFARLAEALGKADSFSFRDAVNTFGRARTVLEYTLDRAAFESLAELSGGWLKAADQINANVKTPKTPGRETLLELLANAERRAAQSRYDDATGRLYRAVELRGQQLARAAFGAELGKISPDDFPANRRADAKAMFGDPDENGIFLLGVQNLYAALQFSEYESLREQGAKYDLLKKHLTARNESLLAHGLIPVSQRTFENFRQAALEVLDVEESEIPRWPPMTLTL